MNIIDRIGKKQMENALCQREIPSLRPATQCGLMLKWLKARASVFRPSKACIARKNNGVNSSFTVRKLSYGEGVERVFPRYAPQVAGLTVVRRGRVRRAKLYYLRGRTGKAARIAEKTTFREASSS